MAKYLSLKQSHLRKNVSFLIDEFVAFYLQCHENKNQNGSYLA